MKLRALRVFDVRQFGGRGVALEDIADGLNSFAEPNETGKSTLFDALHELLFKKHTSTHGDVRSLQPYAGGNPHICIDVETGDGRFRIEKRFLGGGRMARVTDLATGAEIARQDAAEQWIDQTVGLGEPGSGPAGLLWVKQGQSWLQDGGKDARGTALGAMVAQQLDAVTVGERMRAIMDRTARELGALLTSQGRPKAGGPLADATDAVTRLEGEEADLAQRFAALHRDLDNRARLQRDLENRRAATVDTEGEREKIEIAERAEQRAAQRAARLPDVTARAAAARQVKDHAETDLTNFVQTRAAAAATIADIVGLDEKQPALASVTAKAEQTAAEATTALQDAQTTLKAAESAWHAAVSLERRGELERQFAERQDALAKAEAAAAEARTARATAAQIRLDDSSVARIDELDQALRTARTRAEAITTGVEIDYLPGQHDKIRTDDDVLSDGTRLILTTAQVFTIDGIGTLTVTPGAADAANAASRTVAQAETALAEALDKVEMADPASARASLMRKAALSEAAKRAEGIVSTLAPDGIAALADAIARLAATLGTMSNDEADDPASTIAALEQARAIRGAAETNAKRADAALRSALEERRESQEARARHVARLDAALASIGPSAEWDDRLSVLTSRVTAAERELSDLNATLQNLDGAAAEHALATAGLRRVRDTLQNRRDAIHRLEVELAAIEQRFTDARDQGIAETLATTRQALDAARHRHARIDKRARALSMLDDALKSAHRAMRETYFQPVNQELAPLLARVLGGETLAFGDDGFQPERLRRDGLEEDVERLSGGTQEQIAILTRLAFARLLARSGHVAPVILDDALIFSDDDRIEDMFTVLNALTDELQIIVFTCRQRAFESMGGRILTLAEWRPDDT